MYFASSFHVGVTAPFHLLGTCLGQNLAPVFTADMNQHVVMEGTPVGTKVYTLRADGAANGTLGYFIRGSRVFAVDRETGDVVLAQPLDREVSDALKFTVGVEDEQAGATEIPITVIIADENDTPPIFTAVSDDSFFVFFRSGRLS